VNGEFTIEYVELPNGRLPAREFIDSLDDKAAARIDAFIERLRVYGNRMQGKFVKKLTDDIFELRAKQFDRIFRVLFFYQPGMLIVITSGFQKKTQETPPGEIARAEQLRKLWMKYRNRYTGSQKEREAILKELELLDKPSSATDTARLSTSACERAQPTARPSSVPCIRLTWLSWSARCGRVPF
jgi:phage-related protein